METKGSSEYGRCPQELATGPTLSNINPVRKMRTGYSKGTSIPLISEILLKVLQLET
jgi:hypothetical protein